MKQLNSSLRAVSHPLTTPVDWDKLRVFHAAAEAGSFTHAGEVLGLSQSAVSRQVSALEQELSVPLFHRHARGLILTEQGELLFRVAHELLLKLEAVRTKLMDSREKPNGELRVSTTVGLGTGWLAPRVNEFLDLYPDLRLRLILTDEELDLGMREADVAIRLRQPVQADLVQRRLFTIHYHVYVSPDYLKRRGQPMTLADVDRHRIVTFGGPTPPFLQDINWLETAGRPAGQPRSPVLTINNIIGLKRAVQRGTGIGVLPDYLVEPESGLVQLLAGEPMPSFDCYFAYPMELRNSARINVFRDFLLSKAQRWAF